MRYSQVLTVFIFATLLLTSCSDETVAPTDNCDDQSAGGFTISNPERGRVYVWGGTGMAALGQMGKSPGYTKLYWPIDVCFDPVGSPIVLDWNNHRVLAVDGNGKFQRFIGVGGMTGTPPPNGAPALEVELNHPTYVCFSADGSKLYLAAWHNSIVMEMDRTTTWIARYCGTGARNYNGEELPRLQTALDLPVCLAFHPVTGELYMSDQANHILRRIDASGNVHLVAGTAPTPDGLGGWNYQFGYSGDGGPAIGARLSFDRGQNANPAGRFCFDVAGNLYIADTKNHAVRIVTPDGNIDTFAGMGPASGPGHSGDNGPATQARLNLPTDVAADLDGNVFIADTGNHVIRKVASDGTITTVVGVVRPTNSNPISACDLHDEHGAPAREVHLTAPYGIEIDGDGNLWIADTQNHVIRILYR